LIYFMCALVSGLRICLLVIAQTGGGADVMREWWSTRWYTPLLAMGALLLALLVAGVALMEMVAAEVSSAVVLDAWTVLLDRADAALARGNTAAALTAWREAQAAAVRSGQWEGMIAVGDAARRLEASGGPQRNGLALARQAYLTALFRARREHSVEGALRVAAAFGELGDRDVLAQALRVAEKQAGRDPIKRARVRAVVDRWTDAHPEADRRDPTLTGGTP
jgi:hypothetical protein